MVAHAPVHELAPGVVSPAEVYSVMPVLSTKTLPSLVVATATVDFALVVPAEVGVGAVVAAATEVVAGVVGVAVGLELLEQAASVTKANAVSAT